MFEGIALTALGFWIGIGIMIFIVQASFVKDKYYIRFLANSIMWPVLFLIWLIRQVGYLVVECFIVVLEEIRKY